MRLQGYFIVHEHLLTPVGFGMVTIQIEMDCDPGMTLDIVSNGVVLRDLGDGYRLVIGAYSSEQMAELDGIIPNCFICREYEMLPLLRRELAGTEIIDGEERPMVPSSRFAQ